MSIFHITRRITAVLAALAAAGAGLLLFYRLSILSTGTIFPSDDPGTKAAVALPAFIIGAVYIVWACLAPRSGGERRCAGPDELNVRGPYRYTRNPLFFGLFTCCFGWVVYLNSTTCLLVLAAFLFPCAFLLKVREEKRLRPELGEAYLEYKKKVPLIFPFMTKGS